MKHHTKEKGDIGVAKAIADLSIKGFKILTPLTEHLPFDLVVYDTELDIFYKIQCKYKSKTNGVLKVSLKTSYATKDGCFSTRYSKNSFDVISIYCPETDKVYYISSSEVKDLNNSFVLRLDPAKVGVSGVQVMVVRYATDYEHFPTIYDN